MTSPPTRWFSLSYRRRAIENPWVFFFATTAATGFFGVSLPDDGFFFCCAAVKFGSRRVATRKSVRRAAIVDRMMFRIMDRRSNLPDSSHDRILMVAVER